MNKQKITEQILDIISIAENSFRLSIEDYFENNKLLVKNNLSHVAKAFCGSWLGYHSTIYYKDFKQPKAGDHFSPEWGLMSVFSDPVSSNWIEKGSGEVENAIFEDVDNEYIERLTHISRLAEDAFKNANDSMDALLNALIENNPSEFFKDAKDKLAKIRGLIGPDELIRSIKPGGFVSRDSMAISQGLMVPPHKAIEARHVSLYSPFEGLSQLIQLANKLLKYMDMQDLIEYEVMTRGKKIFIGHGRSPLWRELKDFISERLKLDWDEFNREPVAGIATKERISTMLDQACFAFIIMTAEDQHKDELMHARENVIHEAGLFQGKLGFRKAIILKEAECAEFSNIEGLSQIRFPKGNIASIFEEIRKVLEREGILK